jgi:hypothetical protein
MRQGWQRRQRGVLLQLLQHGKGERKKEKVKSMAAAAEGWTAAEIEAAISGGVVFT